MAKNTIDRARAVKTLDKLKGQLNELRGSVGNLSGAQSSNVSDFLSSGNSTLQADLQGVASANLARNAVKNAQDIIPVQQSNTIQDTLAQLRSDNARITKQFKQEQDTRKGIEQTASINQQIAVDNATRDTQASASSSVAGQATSTATPIQDVQQSVPQIGDVSVPGDLQNDPVAVAIAQGQNERTDVVNGQINELRKFVDAGDTDTQAVISNIQNQANAQSQRVAKENERLARAARIAGITAGRGQYSPGEHEGLISEVIQDGLARITDIENTAQEAKLVAKKAFREFKYKAFVQASDMVTALSEAKQNTILEMNNRLNEINKIAKEQIKFDQEQADRNAFILAPDLVGATPQEIEQAALANNIEVGALMRTVSEYKQEQDMNTLDTQLKREQLASSIAKRTASKLPPEKKYTKFTKDELASFAEENGWTPPAGMWMEQAYNLQAEYNGEGNDFIERKAKEVMLGIDLTTTKAVADDIESYVEANLPNEGGNITKIKELFGVKKKDSLSSSESFRNLLASVEIQGGIDGKELSTSQKYQLVWAKAKDMIDNQQKEKGAISGKNNQLKPSKAEVDAARKAGLTVSVKGSLDGNKGSKSKFTVGKNNSLNNLNISGSIIDGVLNQ